MDQGLNSRSVMIGGSPKDRARLREYLLVLRCQTGDEAAFSGLFDRFNQRTFRYLKSLLGPDAADDAQQEVWLTVFRGISKLTNPGAFRTWLYQTTRHRAIDVLRKEKRQSELLTALRTDESEALEESSDLSLEPWDRRSLEAGLAELSAAHREVLLLRFWEEMSYADIALISGCSAGTVRSRLHHAKGKLRNVLHRLNEEAGHGSPDNRNEGGQR